MNAQVSSTARREAHDKFRYNVIKHCNRFSTRSEVEDIADIISNLTGVIISELAIDLAHSDLASPFELD